MASVTLGDLTKSRPSSAADSNNAHVLDNGLDRDEMSPLAGEVVGLGGAGAAGSESTMGFDGTGGGATGGAAVALLILPTSRLTFNLNEPTCRNSSHCVNGVADV